MASKKQILMAGLITLFSSVGYAQKNDTGFDWKDSSKVATRNIPQHNEFKNNQYPYPAMQRNMWEIGASAGYSFIEGDVSSRPGFGGGLSVRKALSHLFSGRLAYTGSLNYGLDYRPSFNSILLGNLANRPGLNPYANAYPNNRLYAIAYRSQIHQGSAEVVVTLNNSSMYRGNPKVNYYLFGGYTFMSADVDVDALNASNQPYNFQTFNFNRSRSAIKSDLKNLMDLKYESNGPVVNGNRNNAGRNSNNQILRHGVTAGGGFAYKINTRVNLGIEQRFSMASFEDGFDAAPKGVNSDVLSFTSLRVNYNIGNASKRVEPLYWLNPNNFIFNELNKPQHMKMPPVVLPDADGDGITDQFDKEPNTPKGAPVDSRGVAKDTDGDGVPDYKDKELLTPQSCFPVNADGVGVCPESPCCIANKEAISKLQECCKGTSCGISNLPSIQFKSNSAALSKDAMAILASVAGQIKANPTCKVKVIGYSGMGSSSKAAQQLSWDRVNAVIRYLVERQGIAEDRFIFTYGESGDNNTVDLMGTTESGPNTVPAPHPNMKN